MWAERFQLRVRERHWCSLLSPLWLRRVREHVFAVRYPCWYSGVRVLWVSHHSVLVICLASKGNNLPWPFSALESTILLAPRPYKGTDLLGERRGEPTRPSRHPCSVAPGCRALRALAVPARESCCAGERWLCPPSFSLFWCPLRANLTLQLHNETLKSGPQIYWLYKAAHNIKLCVVNWHYLISFPNAICKYYN